MVFTACDCCGAALGSLGSIEFCLENVNSGKLFNLAGPDVWQKCTLWFAASLCLLPPVPAFELKSSWTFVIWDMAAAPRTRSQEALIPTETGKSSAADAVVIRVLYRLPLHTSNILLRSRVRLEKNVLNDFNEVCWKNLNNKRFILLF